MGSQPQPRLQERSAAILAICGKMNSERELGPLLELIGRETAILLECESAAISLIGNRRNHPDGSRGPATLRVAVRNRAGEIVGAFEARKKRAGDFTTGDEDALLQLAPHAANAIETAQMVAELHRDRDEMAQQNANLWRDVESRYPHGIVGAGPKIQDVVRLIERIRDSVVNVLITGENGAGKRLVAKAIHFTSPRARQPFISLDCAASPERLRDSSLFGGEKGGPGTLFLDEVADLSLEGQAKILRGLEERADIRLLAATNKNLEVEIAKGNFREDLYYRIKVIHIHLPALRDMRLEIPLLGQPFPEGVSVAKRDAGPIEFSNQVLWNLCSLPWPGNVRQLRNEVTRLAACARGAVIQQEDLGEGLPARAANASQPESLKVATEELEREMIAMALQSTGGINSKPRECSESAAGAHQ